eukprot:TRINITY_DN19917_c0_g1_i1.p1 TRINITY_DN19917_c0_g1~~TRINITY_DN19917_c0_g1_i1.p1  ORF type:complete len:130 (+),score=15.44 TRINITY_DN19917_c0_g1_i1:29-391(+)
MCIRDRYQRRVHGIDRGLIDNLLLLPKGSQSTEIEIEKPKVPTTPIELIKPGLPLKSVLAEYPKGAVGTKRPLMSLGQIGQILSERELKRPKPSSLTSSGSSHLNNGQLSISTFLKVNKA